MPTSELAVPRQSLTWIIRALVLVVFAVRAEDSPGLRLEIDQALGNEADDLAEVLPRTVECIVAKQPERCGIENFALAHLDEAHLRALFSGERVVVSKSGRPGRSGEFRVEFQASNGAEGGVIYFKRQHGVFKAVYVTSAVP